MSNEISWEVPTQSPAGTLLGMFSSANREMHGLRHLCRRVTPGRGTYKYEYGSCFGTLGTVERTVHPADLMCARVVHRFFFPM